MMTRLRQSLLLGLTVGGLIAIGAAAPGLAQPLTGEEVLDSLPGTWEINPGEAAIAEVSENRWEDNRCDGHPTTIRIEETADGLVFESWREDDDAVVRRAAVQELLYGIRIRYDNETHTTTEGEPAEWVIYMRDADHFALRRHPSGGLYATRRRCPEATSP
ncbi:MAG: hypothetical protein PVI23_13895 [Maricaulaceae bacterium]|jgi:hypothetical protein